MDLRGAAEPTGTEREALLASFTDSVSLIENAEKLQEWGAAPEQRLALWMRHLPAVSGARQRGRRRMAGARWDGNMVQGSATGCERTCLPCAKWPASLRLAGSMGRSASVGGGARDLKRAMCADLGLCLPDRTQRRARTTRPRRSGL